MVPRFQKQVGITINVPERAKITIDRQARERGLVGSVWAGRVFDIGFAAICAREKSMPITDADLDAVVGGTLLLWARGDWDTASISMALGVPEATIQRTLDVWREYRRAG